jgi:hypothetical protein
MTTRQIALLLATVIFGAAAYAGDPGHQKVEIRVIADDGDGETHLALDSDDLDFDLHEMQVGENRSIVDKEGRTVLVTRTEDGYSFDIDGKTIDMPLIGAHGGKMEWTIDSEHDKHMGPPPTMFDDGVVIVSDKEIDTATQEIIRNALQAAGHENVHFADKPEGGPHRVHVVKEVVERKE